jgi:hypothetical protein
VAARKLSDIQFNQEQTGFYNELIPACHEQQRLDQHEAE